MVNGIPRFVPNSNYAEAFGEQWKRYRTTQLDSHSGLPITLERTRRCLGEELWATLEGLSVLECGCGAGRFTEILLNRGAHVTSIDLSSAVDANSMNFPINESHNIVQADIINPPFLARQFDVVFCLGVIQHTPNPEQTISALYSLVKPFGWLIIDHYAYDVSWYTKTAPIFRTVMKRMPAKQGMRSSEFLVDLFLPLHRSVRSMRIGQALLSRISPVSATYHSFPGLSDQLHREWALLDTHDALTDVYKHFRTARQIRQHLKRLGLIDIWCEYGGNGVEARGRRPAE